AAGDRHVPTPHRSGSSLWRQPQRGGDFPVASPLDSRMTPNWKPSRRGQECPHPAPLWIIALALFVPLQPSFAQSVLSGRLFVDRFAGSDEKMPLSTILCFANPNGAGREGHSFRSWETEPAGWWR